MDDTFSAMLLVLQMASAQLSPRIIALAFSLPLPRSCVAVFAFTYAFSLAALGRVEERVPQLSVFVALIGNLVSIGLLFWFVHQLTHELVPPLRQEQALLHAAVARHYAEPTDRQRAEVRDLQGIGGLSR